MAPSPVNLTTAEWRRFALRQIALLPVIVFGSEMVVMLLLPLLAPKLGPLQGALADATLLTLLSSPCIWWLVLRPILDALNHERATTAARERLLVSKANEKEFEAQLARGLEMADNEAEAIRVGAHALGQLLPSSPAELLLSDSTHAHFRRELHIGPLGVGPGCAVQSPHQCPAARRGQTITFQDSAAIDACPNLRTRSGGACSGVCLPISMMGRVVGVMHTTGPVEAPPSPDIVSHLQVLADQMGHRIGVLRAVESMQLQASTDPLTGLLNRRSFEARAAEVLGSRRPAVLAMADLDHFKNLNDTYGHEAGDHALRLFARTVRSALRGGDVVGRLGGEEFCLLLTDCTVEGATLVLERIRSTLKDAVIREKSPSFTVSMGLVETTAADTLEELCSISDRALYVAKRLGRDRISLASALGDEAPEPHTAGRPTTRPAIVAAYPS